jgi:hypothetical protein
MLYVSGDGVEHLESYWVVDNVIIDKKVGVATAYFMGYHNHDCREEGKRVVGEKPLVCIGESFESNFSIVALDVSNPFKQAYACFRNDPFFETAIDA